MATSATRPRRSKSRRELLAGHDAGGRAGRAGGERRSCPHAPREQEPRSGGDHDDQVETPETRAPEVLQAAQVDDVVNQEDEPRDHTDDDREPVPRFGGDDKRQDRRDDDREPERGVEPLEICGVRRGPWLTHANRSPGRLGHPAILPVATKPKVDRSPEQKPVARLNPVEGESLHRRDDRQRCRSIESRSSSCQVLVRVASWTSPCAASGTCVDSLTVPPLLRRSIANRRRL